jgi:DNA-binding LacI/PurR family transcriptional regulator
VVSIGTVDEASNGRTRDVPPRPTLEVVAALARVSRATASRVLRGDPRVREETREAVLRAAGEVSYTVNRAARSLVTNRTDSVAFLVAENEDRFFSDPYFLGMLRGAQAETARVGLQLVFVVASTPEELTHFENYARAGHVDGVLLISLHGDDLLPQHLESMRVPTVLNGRPMSGDDSIYYVDSDNVGGGRAATRVLIERGAKRIATITGPLDMCAGLDRLRGFRDEMQAAGLTPEDRHVVAGDFTVAGGTRAMLTLLDADPDIDAVFAASDLTALGAIHALTDRGLAVPNDVAVVGFDDVLGAEVANPPLTTVHQPIDELGRTMARVLFDRISGTATSRVSVLPVHVVPRRSA